MPLLLWGRFHGGQYMPVLNGYGALFVACFEQLIAFINDVHLLEELFGSDSRSCSRKAVLLFLRIAIISLLTLLLGTKEREEA
jgi:hypothetical protein